ncbi:MAG: discoidin domain-containing protein [Candidatus Omnitrophica bacterium]|nr:discoidin domain-containing protein [Candidatus Omnitrophota bacterium]
MKRLFGVVILSVLFLPAFIVPAYCAGTPAPAPVIKGITASSEIDNNRPEKAIDNSLRTRWESEFRDNQWLQVEFEQPVDLYGIEIKWETAAAYKYKVLGSADGAAWQALAEINDGNEGEDIKINFKKKAACKFVKIDCLERATAWGFSIWEIEFKTDKPYKDIPKRIMLPKGNTFFTVRQEKGKHWFIGPNGKRFISKGVNVVLIRDAAVLPNSEYYDVSSKHKDNVEWARSAIKRLKKFNFNTIGSWSDPAAFYYDMPFTVMLGIPSTTDHRLVDIFDPLFDERAEQSVSGKCRHYKDSKYLLGYFIENELPWYGDVGWYTGHATTLLDEYAKLPEGAPGRQKLAEFLQQKYGKSIDEFMLVRGAAAKEARELFAGLVAERYFSVVSGFIRKYDPNHMILGVRFANSAPDEVTKACGRYCDVVSVNYYCKDMKVNKEMFDNFYFLGQKPIMITEFSYRAMENNSGDKNTKGADVTVQTQQDRAEGFNKYVTQMMEFPYLTGYHWFQYFDESPQGRSFDGENSDYGIVDIHDNEYRLLTAEMKKINAAADTMHKKSAAPYPDKLVKTGGYAKVNNKDIGRESEPFCDIAGIDAGKLGVWSDTATTAGIKFSGEQAADSGPYLKCSVDTGSGWGCGFGVPCQVKTVNSDGSFDFQGFKGIRIKMSLAEGMPFSVFMNESGAADLGKVKYGGVNGADGESFASETGDGTGKTETYEFPFDEFTVRNMYGNQGGNKTFDLQAVRNIDLYFPGNTGTGECDIYEVTLY